MIRNRVYVSRFFLVLNFLIALDLKIFALRYNILALRYHFNYVPQYYLKLNIREYRGIIVDW